MAAITSGVYFRHKLEKRIKEKMQEWATESMVYPSDGANYWRRVGHYQAFADLLTELESLDKE